jgi:two-component system, OmpR family, response regulator
MRLLLVEPYFLLARPLQRGLEEEGFAVDTVVDRAGADARVRKETYDVILLDLPASSGMDTVRTWRSEGLRTPVLIFSASGPDPQQNGDLYADGLDVASKPFVMDDLLTRLRKLAAANVNGLRGVRQ